MRALDPEVVDAVWDAISALIPVPVDDHPLGCHRARIADRVCFQAILIRLVTGCSWVDTERLSATPVSDTTLRARRDEWIDAGVFDKLFEEAIVAYDRILGLDLSEVALDGSLHKAPCGGEGTGKNPTDRGKLGWKWSIATDAQGMVIGWAIDGANRHDIKLFEPTLSSVESRGLVVDIETLHLDRGYDSAAVRALLGEVGIDDAVIARRRRPGQPPGKQTLRLGLRWTVERTNSWLSNLGQLRRNTDRHSRHRHAQLAFAVTLLITAKLIDWAARWST